MGLDTYIHKELSLESISSAVEVTVVTLKHKTGKTNIFRTYNPVSLIENIIYWRKAYAIKDWIENRIKEKPENCERVYIDKNVLIDLLEDCRKVAETPEQLHEIFPIYKPYNELSHYQRREALDEIDDTIVAIERELLVSENEVFEAQYIYESNW